MQSKIQYCLTNRTKKGVKKRMMPNKSTSSVLIVAELTCEGICILSVRAWYLNEIV